MKPYRPSIRRLQEDFAQRLARKRMLERARARAGDTPTKRPDIDMDNSEPWLRNPNCIADYIYIAKKVTECVEIWGPKQSNSSAS